MTDEILEPVQGTSKKNSHPPRLDGVVIGVLVGFNNTGTPLVAFPGNAIAAGQSAKSSTALSKTDVGREVALLFENADPARPLIIGRIQHPEEFSLTKKQDRIHADVDGERIEFNATKEIVLRCGKASITLTRAGKILIRGTYVLSRSSGANRIKGGSVQIN